MKFLNNTARLRNCRNKNNSPLDGKCLTSNMIYEAQITSNKPNYKEKVFKGTAETDFKRRFNNDTKSFNPNTVKAIWNYLENSGLKNAIVSHYKTPGE